MGPGLGTAHTHRARRYPYRLALASSPGRASLSGIRRTAHRGLSCVAVLRALRAPRFRRERLRHHKRHQSEWRVPDKPARNPDTRATHGAPPARGAVGSRPERRSDSERRCAMGATQQRQPSNAWTCSCHGERTQRRNEEGGAGVALASPAAESTAPRLSLALSRSLVHSPSRIHSPEPPDRTLPGKEQQRRTGPRAQHDD